MYVPEILKNRFLNVIFKIFYTMGVQNFYTNPDIVL